MSRKFSENPKIDANLKKAYEFFRGKTGRVGHDAESSIALARAELAAAALGWKCEWQDDYEPWDPGDTDYEPREVLGCVLRDGDGDVLGSLWGIADPDRTYRRMVEAELALEALSEKGLL